MELGERYDDALTWASELHRRQRRKGSPLPYLAHLMSVSSLVIEYGGDEDQAIAGLLHDSIEDVGVTDDEIAGRFGDRVAGIVRACTDADTVPKPPWLERKRAYIAHLVEADTYALLVSLADKVHNATSIAEDVERAGDSYFEVFKGGVEGTRWYYRRLADAFGGRMDDFPVNSFEGRISAGGRELFGRYLREIGRFGCTSQAADAFEMQADTWKESPGAVEQGA